MQLRCVDDRRARTLAPLLARWAYDAGFPLDEWRFGGEQQALQTLEAWVLRSTSEVAFGRWRVAFVDEAPRGGYLAMDEPDLVAARRSDLLALVTAVGAVGELRDRLAAISELFPPVQSGDLYLSRITVELEARGRGLGTSLLSAVVGTAARTGAKAVRADVSAENDAAIALYRAAGFEIGPPTTSESAGFSYHAVRLQV